jgi:hypothetical protein
MAITATSIEDVLMLLGVPLSDADEQAKTRFRRYIAQAKWGSDDYRAWIDECIKKGGRDSASRVYYCALQDIVVSLGKRLGLEVEYGRYSGSQAEPAFDGLWKRASGEVIVLEVKTSPWPVDKVRQLGDYLDELAKQEGWEPASVYGLYAIGPGDYEALITQIRGSEWRNQIRVISFENLLRLIELAEQLDVIGGPHTGAPKVQRILLPVETIDLGDLIDLIMEIAEFRRQEAASEVEEEAEEGEAEGELWERQELLKYLRDTTTYQKALLGALAGVSEDWISRKQLLHLMGKVATILPEAQDHEITGYTIAGARAGLKMRRGNKEDIIEQREGRYRLKADYRDIIVDWARAEGLLEPLKGETF